MSNIATVHTQATWNSESSTNSSTSSATRYALNPSDPRSIVVWRWDGDIAKMSQSDLCRDLDQHHDLRVTKKSIPKMTSVLDIRQRDLLLSYEHNLYERFPNYNSAIAAIKLPSSVYWGRLLGSYDQLYIVSPETSPTASPGSRSVSHWPERYMDSSASHGVALGADRDEGQ